jgi:hypothetical protein
LVGNFGLAGVAVVVDTPDSEPWPFPPQLQLHDAAGLLERRQAMLHFLDFVGVPGFCVAGRRAGLLPGDLRFSVDARRVCTATFSPPKVVTTKPNNDTNASTINVTLCTVNARRPNTPVSAPHAPDTFVMCGAGM